jgi:hypothetical protein
MLINDFGTQAWKGQMKGRTLRLDRSIVFAPGNVRPQGARCAAPSAFLPDSHSLHISQSVTAELPDRIPCPCGALHGKLHVTKLES